MYYNIDYDRKNIISFLRIEFSLLVKRWVPSLKDALFCVMFEWSWPSGSGEEETVKSLQIYGQKLDNRQSEKLIWGWSSGELIRSTIARLDCLQSFMDTANHDGFNLCTCMYTNKPYVVFAIIQTSKLYRKFMLTWNHVNSKPKAHPVYGVRATCFISYGFGFRTVDIYRRKQPLNRF